jgi:hypothetical protein
MYTLVNQVSVKPLNCNVGYMNSWLSVMNNAQREFCAQASYITNFDDLSISLSAADLNIGSVHIQDPDSGLQADVVPVGIGTGALRVLSQDLESTEDDVTIGDRSGNMATVVPSYSALRVYPVVSNGGYTRCQTLSSGNPSFLSSQILLHNSSNSDVFVNLTLSSGTSCLIPIGKNSSANHILILNLSVLSINDYAGCQITFFA